MERRLEGTVALITGASSGIGWATARVLAGHGACVALAARRTERLRELAAAIDAEGGRALPLHTDVTSEAEAAAAVEGTVAEFGRLDILVNNAGVMLLGPMLDAPVHEWERMVSLNLLGVLYTTGAALPHLLRAAETSHRRVADLVNISSVAGRKARAGAGVYNLTKFGVIAASESLRQELARRHVRVSVVEPGAVRTELINHVRPDVRAQSAQTFAAIEQLQAEDIADAIEYIVTRPRHVAVNEMLIRPTEQEF